MKQIRILGLSSATNTVGAAVVDAERVLSESSVSGDVARSEKLIGLADRALGQASLKIGDVDAVAVAIGPGSYSGLRGAVATAKGLAASLDIPVISVPTLDAAAYNFIGRSGTVLVAINACRDDYNAALFGFSGGSMKRLTDDVTMKLERITELISQVRGELTVACDRDISGHFKSRTVAFAPVISAIPYARNVATIGLAKFRKKDFEDLILLKPVYSHKPNIREFSK